MSEKIKETITNFSEWAKPNFISIIIFLICYMLMFLGFVMFSWAFGYWANAFYGMKFELGSCWQGITVVVAGFGGVAGLAKYGLDKYKTDSQYNSNAGEHPYEKIAEEIKEEFKKNMNY